VLVEANSEKMETLIMHRVRDMRSSFAILLAALSISAAHAHSLTIEKGDYYVGETVIQWEVATAHARIRAADVGRPGAMFVGATTDRGRMMTLTEQGWVPFSAGTVAPAAVFDALPNSHSVIVFNSRDLDRHGKHRYDTGLTGETLCDAAHALGTSRFAIAVGYGVLDQSSEAIIERAQSLGTGLDVDHMRLAFVNSDMMNKKKWNEVYRVECVRDGGG
jgi:hypothetical protein